MMKSICVTLSLILSISFALSSSGCKGSPPQDLENYSVPLSSVGDLDQEGDLKQEGDLDQADQAQPEKPSSEMEKKNPSLPTECLNGYIPLAECPEFCDSFCSKIIQVKCDDSSDKRKAFRDKATCMKICMDGCENCRAIERVMECVSAGDCDAVVECIQALGAAEGD